MTGTQASATASWRGAIRGNVLMMGVVSLLTDFSSEMIYPLLPVFLTGLAGLSAATVYLAWMEGIAEATASLLKIFSGRISDAWGMRKVPTLLGYGLSTVCRPLMALAGSAGQVIAIRFADRIGKGVRTAPRDALIGDSVAGEFRGLAFSFHRAMDHAGAVAGPVTAIILLAVLWPEAMGQVSLWQKPGQATAGEVMSALRWLFAIALVPGLAAMAVLLIGVREIRPQPRAAPAGSLPGGTAWRRLPRSFWWFVATVTLFALGNSSDLFIVFYGLARFQLGLVHLIGLWIVLHLSKIVFSLPGGALSDRLGRRPMIVAGWCVYALCYLGMAVAGAAWQFWALIVLYGVYYGLSEGAERALVTDFVPSADRGAAFGIYHAAVGMAVLPANVIFGWVWKYAGAVWAFSFGTVLAGLAAVGLLVLLSASRRQAIATR
jgi:MFS family permease